MKEHTREGLGMGTDRSVRLAEAKQWLAKQLETGVRAQKELLEGARLAGISSRTLRRAKDSLQVRSSKDGMRAPWVWSLPECVHEHAEEGQGAQEEGQTQQGNLDTFATECTTSSSPIGLLVHPGNPSANGTAGRNAVNSLGAESEVKAVAAGSGASIPAPAAPARPFESDPIYSEIMKGLESLSKDLKGFTRRNLEAC